MTCTKIFYVAPSTLEFATLAGVLNVSFRDDKKNESFSHLSPKVSAASLTRNENIHRRINKIPSVLGSDLNEKQGLTHDVFLSAVCQNGTSNWLGRLQMWLGKGGCGKTHVKRAIINTLNAAGKKEATFGTLGIALVNVRGANLHNLNRGFGIPIGTSYKPLSSKTFRQLERLHLVDLDYMITGEPSILKQREVYWLHKLSCEFKGNNKPFGGLCILLVVDMGQLPAVGCSVSWNEKSNTNDYKLGYNRYRQFDIVTRLTVNEGLDRNYADVVAYSEILFRLHDDENTLEGAQLIKRMIVQLTFQLRPSRRKWFHLRSKSHCWWTEKKKRKGVRRDLKLKQKIGSNNVANAIDLSVNYMEVSKSKNMMEDCISRWKG